MPADMMDGCEVVPTATDPGEGALQHFGTITAVIDRQGRRMRYCVGTGWLPLQIDYDARARKRPAGSGGAGSGLKRDSHDVLRDRSLRGRIRRGGGHASAEKPQGKACHCRRRLPRLAKPYNDLYDPILRARYCKGCAMTEAARREAAGRRETLARILAQRRPGGAASTCLGGCASALHGDMRRGRGRGGRLPGRGEPWGAPGDRRAFHVPAARRRGPPVRRPKAAGRWPRPRTRGPIIGSGRACSGPLRPSPSPAPAWPARARGWPT